MDFQQASGKILKETGFMQLKSVQQEAIDGFVSGGHIHFLTNLIRQVCYIWHFTKFIQQDK